MNSNSCCLDGFFCNLYSRKVNFSQSSKCYLQTFQREHAPLKPVEGLKTFFSPLRSSKNFFMQESHFKPLQNVGNGFERRSRVYESLTYHSRILTCREQRLHVVIRMHTFKSSPPPPPPSKKPTKLEQGSHFRLAFLRLFSRFFNVFHLGTDHYSPREGMMISRR